MFKTIDIKNTNEGGNTAFKLVRARETVVHHTDKPVKKVGIYKLGHRILDNLGLGWAQVCHDLFGSSDDLLADNPLFELVVVDTEELGSQLQRRIVVSKHCVVATADFDISEV